MVMFIPSVFEQNFLFYSKFVSKSSNCLLKLKLGAYNHFHNILRYFEVLPNFPFTTTETIRDHYL